MESYSPEYFSKDTVFGLLATERRRVVVRLLLEERDEWEIAALATAVAAHERDGPPDTADEETTRRSRIALLHRDLPMLADAGVVVFNVEDAVVAPDEHIDELAPLV